MDGLLSIIRRFTVYKSTFFSYQKSNVIQSEAKEPECIKVDVTELLRFALDDKMIVSFYFETAIFLLCINGTIYLMFSSILLNVCPDSVMALASSPLNRERIN